MTSQKSARKIKKNPESPDNRIILPERKRAKTSHKLGLGLGILAILVLTYLLILNIAYASKLFPGTWGNGVYLGGMTKSQALDLLNQKTSAYLKRPIIVTSENNSWQIDPEKINVSFQNEQLINDLYNTTHSLNVLASLSNQMATIFGLNKKSYKVSFDADKLSGYLIPINDAVSTPVSDAFFGLSDENQLIINPSISGNRINTDQFLKLLEKNIGLTSSEPVMIPAYQLASAVSENDLRGFEPQVRGYLAKPLVLVYANKNFEVKPKQILSWVRVKSTQPTVVKKPSSLSVFLQRDINFSSGLDQESVSNYLTELSGQINQSPQDARLSFGAGGLRVVAPSRDGRSLNIAGSAQAIIQALGENSELPDRKVRLAVEIKRPDVREDNLATLGINELIGEGVTYFPGSSANRITNIKVGSSKFNGVLLK
ncbi:MAG: peptidoglycan binding domain-containing protein, partial [bacterium]|nr:peptidoglycan binding domain-containing protein [bacterium]